MPMKPNPTPEPAIRVRIEYLDAAGNWHGTYAIERDDGRRVRGEAVHDPKLGRTVFDEELPGLLPGDIRLVKRAMAAACAERIKAGQGPVQKDGQGSNG